jgi:hypothetical protein
MRTKAIATILIAVAVTLAAAPLWAATWDGTVKLGGTILDETGDLSAVQETYNVYEGFSVAQVRVNGTLDPRKYFSFDLRDINQSSRAGDLVFRVPGTFKFTAGYDQNRQVFDPVRGVNSFRKDWKAGAQLTPNRWLNLSGSLNYLARDGARLAYPTGTASVLGARYDNTLKAGEVTADVQKGRRGGGISFRMSDYSDALASVAKRSGQVVSARCYAPTPFYDKWTHMVRAAYGTRKLSDSDVEWTMADVRYTGIVQPLDAYRVKYSFGADRVDDKAARLKTDRFQNDLDATWYHPYGDVSGGAGYEMNDDDRSLTSYKSWRLGTSLHYKQLTSARVDYASRVKQDQEELTLLKDIESSQVRAKFQLQPMPRVVVGGSYQERERELTDLHVTANGKSTGAFGRYTYEGWGAASADYSYANDEYRDLTGGFRASSQAVTGRVDFSRIKNLTLAGGVTFLKLGKDLDIEKSMVFAEGNCRLLDGYHLEVKYNVYNYDDYVLLNRYYTANVVRINLAYDFHSK